MTGITAFQDHYPTGSVLVTGAAGVVGRAIVDQLACIETTGRPRLSLAVVGKRRPNDHSRVTFIDGDASEYRMGLTRTGYDTLIHDVRAVVHLAADSAVPGDGVNRRVAREAMDVCERAGAHFYYVSTAFAAHAEDAANPASRRAEATEHNLEAAIRASGVPHTVVRTSLVIGDSVTGRIGEFPAIYQVIDALLQGLLLGDQLDHRALLDFVPCDTVADVICRLIENNVEDREVWLTAGEQALTIDQVLQAVQTLARESGPELRQPWPAGSSGSDRQRFTRRRAVTTIIDRYVSTMARHEPLESSLGDRFQNSLGELGSWGVAELPDPSSSLLTSLRYWASRTASPVRRAAVA